MRTYSVPSIMLCALLVLTYLIQLLEVDSLIIPPLQGRKLRHREVAVYRAGEW